MQYQSILKKLRSMVPIFQVTQKKGKNGRIAVIGGSEEYTGAPYYSAISILKGGGDLAHIFCSKNASIPIKSYSPEIIVHAYLCSKSDCSDENYPIQKLKTLENLQSWNDKFHGYVVGPGIGRDNFISDYLPNFLSSLESKKILTIDADGIWYLTHGNRQKLQQIFKHRANNLILTPNQAEFDNLCNVFLVGGTERLKRKDRQELSVKYYTGEGLQNKSPPIQEVDISHPLVVDNAELAQLFGNINVLHKGLVDVISNGITAYIISNEGSKKRCGGVGDILSGLTSLYGYWGNEYGENFDANEKTLMGCVLSSYITRKASYKAFQKHKYGLTAPNIIDEIIQSFNEFNNSSNQQ